MTPDLPALFAALQSNDPTARLAAAEELAHLGPDAMPAAVALVEACAGDDELRDWAVAALEDLGAPPASDVAPLASLLRHPSLDTAYWAATLLGRLESQAAPAVPELVAAVETHAEMAVRQRAVWALGRIGPGAGPASAALRNAAASDDPRLAGLAREAIERIGG